MKKKKRRKDKRKEKKKLPKNKCSQIIIIHALSLK